jgi:regulator of extracellular matrix RemA (YlzA/DUF370 family)
MYIHLGNDVLVSFSNLISIINIEKQMTKETKAIIDIAELKKKLVMIGREDKNKSLVICKDKVFISPISSSTLFKRASHLNWEDKYGD